MKSILTIIILFVSLFTPTFEDGNVDYNNPKAIDYVVYNDIPTVAKTKDDICKSESLIKVINNTSNKYDNLTIYVYDNDVVIREIYLGQLDKNMETSVNCTLKDNECIDYIEIY